MTGFHIEHFGCRAARADGEAMAGNLRAMSELEPFANDVVVVNTCSVTAEADRIIRATFSAHGSSRSFTLILF